MRSSPVVACPRYVSDSQSVRPSALACLGHHGVLHELLVGVGRTAFEQARLEEVLHVRM